MLELIKAGGLVMAPILLLAVLALAIVIERFWSLRRKDVLPPGLGDEVREWARGRQLDPEHIDVLRRNELQVWFVAAHTVDIPLVER